MNDKRTHEADEAAVVADHEDSPETIDEPVLDGANEADDPDVDPRKGMEDPQLIRDTEAERPTVHPYL
ncbi:hypothetical protein ACIFOC_02512 [Leucobacter aridicollis]|uniref:Uncharacterized protein n=1 Tax=Leucobacter aridicollis TaxID=283878 RepID=A0A852QYK7_9MICO|nr:hypothetical protein [Leucobacter aridicollis]MBL3683456.1 hypothetical protein [Leucobacter aridicollis]MCS3428840.1 hypothetical protein [Leucobacter aridicollis]NYD25237.1 hypothetical protein [Leucobacter aridicollis]RKQ90005.1 hypothetical protein U746_1253 [Mycolicibacterium mucogenicum 261Sha1.1M5]